MDGPPIHGNTRLEVVWTAVPAILIVSLCTYAYTVLRSNEANKPDAMTVNVTARQFAFQFEYPQTNGKQVVSPVLYLPVNQPVVFKLRSYDVIHSFFVPNFSEKLDAVPGIVTTVRVTPNALGTYPVECTELCGAGHSLMRATCARGEPIRVRELAALPARQRTAADRDPAAERHRGRPRVLRRAARARPPRARPRARRPRAPGRPRAPPPARRCSPGTRDAAAATRSPPRPPPAPSGRISTTRLKADCALPASQKIRGTTLQKCIETAITHPYAYLPTGYSAGIMPNDFAQRLTSDQTQALVNFLSTAANEQRAWPAEEVSCRRWIAVLVAIGILVARRPPRSPSTARREVERRPTDGSHDGSSPGARRPSDPRPASAEAARPRLVPGGAVRGAGVRVRVRHHRPDPLAHAPAPGRSTATRSRSSRCSRFRSSSWSGSAPATTGCTGRSAAPPGPRTTPGTGPTAGATTSGSTPTTR